MDTCCFCGAPLGTAKWQEGCNPWPLAQGGKCCQWCDDFIVMPARVASVFHEMDYEQRTKLLMHFQRMLEYVRRTE